MSKNKIQSLLVNHLLKHGQIELLLPDGMTVEIGITQENNDGKLVVKKNYCWVIASKEDREASLDSFNMGLRFADDKDIILFDDRYVDQNGEPVRKVEVV